MKTSHFALTMGMAVGLINTTLAADYYVRSRALRPVQVKTPSTQKPKPKKATKSKTINEETNQETNQEANEATHEATNCTSLYCSPQYFCPHHCSPDDSSPHNDSPQHDLPHNDSPHYHPPVSPTETEMRQVMATMPNSVLLLDAVDNGLIPRSMFSAMDDGSPCGTIPGESSITSNLSVPQNSNLLTIEGIFTPSDGSLTNDNIEVTLYGVNGRQGSSSIKADGSFQIVLTDPLPGVVPYFLSFTPKDCNEGSTRKRRQLQVASPGIALLYVENANIVAVGQLTITLTWSDDYSDVDLHIIEPGGNKVFFGSKCGDSCPEDAGSCDFVSPDLAGSCAYLDRDDTDGRGPEHYYARNPKDGKYKLYVNMWNRHNVDYIPVTWTLSAKVGTKTVWTETGTFDNTRDLYNRDNNAYEKMFGPFELDTTTIEKETEMYIKFRTALFLMLQEISAESGVTRRKLTADDEPGPEDIVPGDRFPLAATDWFPVTDVDAGKRDYLNFVYLMQHCREVRNVNALFNGDSVPAVESLFERVLNEVFGDNATLADFTEMIKPDRGGILTSNYFFADEDMLEGVQLCSPYQNYLDRAICAGGFVRSVMQRYVRLGAAHNVTKVCRHHAVAHAGLLRELGFTSFTEGVPGSQNKWRFFFSGNVQEFNGSGHIWLGVTIDGNNYLLDSVNDRNIQIGVQTNRFSNVGNATISTADPSKVNDDLTFSLTRNEIWQRGAVWSKYPIWTKKDFFVALNMYLGASDSGGDGIMFVLQSDSRKDKAIGETGGHFLAYG
ncbi:hypothetical protein IV203_012564 [Nitzschia inconspicua]|uniref:Uncharacterized protein n=1 Tax=Nitzschia inconspicua TaxID=303405 RepID=A0A9K3KUE7_9STRA|nr:hypothetical protein IV203_012564 [Nitzschia inconspicua]